MKRKKPTTNKTTVFVIRLRQPDIEALYGLASHYQVGRSDVVRLLLEREWAKIQATQKEGSDESEH